jgi:hypothetical protein
MNVEIRTEAAQFLFGEKTNRIFFAVYTLISTGKSYLHMHGLFLPLCTEAEGVLQGWGL